MNTPVREGETIGGVPYHAESTLKCSSAKKEKEFLRYKPLSQHTGTTRARTGADWHTHRLTTGAA